jgi:hypothetical protein
METRFGARFDDVRVHTDGAAANAADAVSAHAYTVGNHIWFGRGELRDDAAGKELLAHELTHVLQNREGAPAGGELVDGVRVSSPGDAREREAVTTAREVMTGPLEDVPEAIATRLEHTFAGEDSALHAGAFAFGAQALFGVSRAERNEDQDRHGESGALTAEQEALLEQVQARLGSIKRVAPKPAGRARSRGPARSTG